MKTDTYTKVVLTAIAVLLAVIALKLVASPQITASAQGAFTGVQVSGMGNGNVAVFDSRSGMLYEHNLVADGAIMAKYRLVKVGEKLRAEQ
jgi:hypothetical protein